MFQHPLCLCPRRLAGYEEQVKNVLYKLSKLTNEFYVTFYIKQIKSKELGQNVLYELYKLTNEFYVSFYINLRKIE